MARWQHRLWQACRGIGQRLLTIWLAVTLVFGLLRLLPGLPFADELTQAGLSAERQSQYWQAAGLDQPLLTQYLRYLAGIMRGEVGVSLARGIPVSELLAEGFQSTLEIALPALLIAVIAGTGIGIAASGVSSRARRWIGQGVINLAVSLPVYWTGTLAILIFSVMLDWLPASGDGSQAALVLPVMVLAFHTAGSIGRVTQGALDETLTMTFIRTARAKGLPEPLILRRHMLRVGLLPVLPVLALQTGFLLGGTVVTESLFARPGLGRVLLDGVLRRDYPVVQAVVLLSVLMYIGLTLAADLTASLLDPRIRIESQ